MRDLDEEIIVILKNIINDTEVQSLLSKYSESRDTKWHWMSKQVTVVQRPEAGVLWVPDPYMQVPEECSLDG